MKPVALSSQATYWECQDFARLYGSQTGKPLPFQFLSLSIGPFYRHFPHRLFTYLLMAACLIGGVFLALGIDGQTSVVSRQLPLACTLALYLATLFTLSHVLSDLAANCLCPRRMAYGSRSVGRQCLVLLSGLVLGFWVNGMIFPHLMQLCAQAPGSYLPPTLWVAPLLVAALYACVFMVPMSQQSAGEKNQPKAGPAADPALSAPQTAPATKVSFRIDGREARVPLKAISHLSMEDHYCRVYLKSGQGLKDFLARETLKGLVKRLGSDNFLHIHRSHLVNKRQVRAYQRKGRNHYLLLGPGKVTLPISRRRQAQVKAALAGLLPR